jgi:hypothetical protein
VGRVMGAGVARSWFLIAVSLANVACGSRTDLDEGRAPNAPRCEAPSPCGGELFGRWQAVAACTDLGFIGALLPCDALEVRAQSPSIRGFKRYSRDGRYSSSLSYSGSARIFVPDSCSDLGSGSVSCSSLEELLRRRGELLLSDIVCEVSDGGCICDADLLPFESEDSGTFSAREGHLIEESGREADYCVDGDTLRLSQGSGDQLVFSKD